MAAVEHCSELSVFQVMTYARITSQIKWVCDIHILIKTVAICVRINVPHCKDVTMYQRSPTYVMSVKEGITRLFKGKSSPTQYWTCIH